MNHPGLNLDFTNLRHWHNVDAVVLGVLDVTQKYIEELEAKADRLYKLEDKLNEMDTPDNAKFIEQLKEFKNA